MNRYKAAGAACVLIGGGAGMLVLADCAGGRHVDFKDALSGMIGAPAAAATRMLGAADTIRPEAAGTTYVWIAKARGTPPEGRHSHANAKGAEIAAILRANPNAAVPRQPCTVVMTTDVTERIRTFRIAGDRSHCEAFEAKVAARP